MISGAGSAAEAPAEASGDGEIRVLDSRGGPSEMSSRPASEQGSGPQWYEYGGSSGQTWNCLFLGGGYTEQLGRSWVGFYGDLEANPMTPRTGNVYYTKVGWGVSGFPCGNGGAYVHVEIGLPAYTELAISSTNKVRCWYQRPDGQNLQDFTSDPECPQQPQQGQQGGLAFDPVGTQSGAWPTATGAIWEIWVPVKTSQPLDGIYRSSPTPCPSCFTAGVWMIDGNYSPWSYPQIGVPVAQGTNPTPAQPAVDYPTPSIQNQYYDPNHEGGASYGESVGYVFTEGTTGTAYMQIGAVGYPLQTGPTYSLSSAGGYEIRQGWWMSPGQTWRWRLCYDPAGAAGAVCGTQQYFDTAPPPDTTRPTTGIESGPKSMTNKRKALFTFSSNELNVSYECSLDGALFTPCESATPTFTGLSEGPHTLGVVAKDGAGNRDQSPANWAWTVDTTPPNTTINAGPSGTVSSRKATFKFNASQANSTFLCSLDGARFKSCISPKTYQDLKKGSHTFRTKAKDPAGNVDPTPAERIWRIS